MDVPVKSLCKGTLCHAIIGAGLRGEHEIVLRHERVPFTLLSCMLEESITRKAASVGLGRGRDAETLCGVNTWRGGAWAKRCSVSR